MNVLKIYYVFDIESIAEYFESAQSLGFGVRVTTHRSSWDPEAIPGKHPEFMEQTVPMWKIEIFEAPEVDPAFEGLDEEDGGPPVQTELVDHFTSNPDMYLPSENKVLIAEDEFGRTRFPTPPPDKDHRWR